MSNIKANDENKLGHNNCKNIQPSEVTYIKEASG